MSGGKLTKLQWRILRVLAALEPPWTLTGGAALAGIHLQHRVTRDLDLFWRGRGVLEPLPWEVGEALIDGAPILVDSPHEILVNKLCALLSRSELRDVLDIKGLVESGADLDRAVADAPRKDAGFSPLTLAWLLEGMKPRLLAQALNPGSAETEGIVRFHALLIERLLASGAPE